MLPSVTPSVALSSGPVGPGLPVEQPLVTDADTALQAAILQEAGVGPLQTETHPVQSLLNDIGNDVQQVFGLAYSLSDPVSRLPIYQSLFHRLENALSELEGYDVNLVPPHVNLTGAKLRVTGWMDLTVNLVNSALPVDGLSKQEVVAMLTNQPQLHGLSPQAAASLRSKATSTIGDGILLKANTTYDQLRLAVSKGPGDTSTTIINNALLQLTELSGAASFAGSIQESFTGSLGLAQEAVARAHTLMAVLQGRQQALTTSGLRHANPIERPTEDSAPEALHWLSTATTQEMQFLA